MTQESSGPFDLQNVGSRENVSCVEREAIEWVVRLGGGEASAADRAAFAEWRARSPEHAAVLAMARRLWLGVGQALPTAAKVRPRRQWPLLALAASLLLVLALGYRVFGGREDAVRLADGSSSVVHGFALPGREPLASTLEVDGVEGRCRLILGRGDAYFDVTPNPAQSLADEAAETQVRVFDAAFSVRSEAAAVLVTIIGGRVEVEDGKAARVLAAGQQLRCHTEHREAVFKAYPYAIAAWRHRYRQALALESATFRRLTRY